MDTLFFILSKLFWAIISPDSLIVILGLGAWLAAAAGWLKAARRLASCVALMVVLISFFPLGEWLLAPLEQRFPANVALPANPTGIIVLGGAISPELTDIWKQPELGSAADRLTSFAYLANLYPNAQLLFTGGSGSVTQQEFKEAIGAQILFEQLQINDRAILYESESRNTIENVRNSKELVNPKINDEWILITSAFHMPRSVGLFCKQQWPVTAYPVDHQTKTGGLLRLEYNFAGNLALLKSATREWVGLITYRILGHTDQILANPQSCSAPAN